MRLDPLLTDEQRIAVARELWALHIERRAIHMDQTLTEYEQEATARLRRADTVPDLEDEGT